MPRDHVDNANLTVTGDFATIEDNDALDAEQSADAVVIIVTRAFGPGGDQLVGLSDVAFDGCPAVTVEVRADGRKGQVHLSPIHGDRRKAGFTDIPVGAKCELYCPVSGQRLDHVGRAEDGSGADYWAIYLTPKLSQGEMIAISDVWGHYHSRIVDNFELMSAWATEEDRLAAVPGA